MKSFTAVSALLSLSLFLGQLHFASAIWPCYYINFIPFVGSFCPVEWSKEKIYSGASGNPVAESMSANGQVVAFPTDSTTVVVMKKGIFGWDQLGDDIQVSSTQEVAYTFLNYDGTTLTIQGLDSADSIPKLYVFRFGASGSLCLLPVVGLLCSWEQDARFQDAGFGSIDFSGEFIAISDTGRENIKTYARNPFGVWDLTGRVDAGFAIADVDASGSDLFAQENLAAGTQYKGGIGCSSAGLVPCEYEEGASVTKASSGNQFYTFVSKNHQVLAVLDGAVLGETKTDIYKLKCLLDCTWEKDVSLEDSEGYIVRLTPDGSIAVGISFASPGEIQIWFDKPLVGWEKVGDAFEGPFVSPDFYGDNGFSASGNQIIGREGAASGDIYISTLA